MLRAVRRGLEVRREAGIAGVATGDRVDAALAAAGLEVRPGRPYRGRVQGMLGAGVVYLRAGIWPETALVVKTHELGHHLLHADGAFYVRHRRWMARSRAEDEADVFAWTVLIGRPSRSKPGLTRQMRRAHDAGLPLDWLCDTMSALLARAG